MFDVITIGESLVLFSPVNTGSLKYVEYFRKQLGGAESNFAIGISRLGCKAGWISRVGDDSFGDYILSIIRGEGVDISKVKIDKTSSTAVYFKEFNELNGTKVYYYRNGSAASKIEPDDLDEDYIASAKYLHITGITIALSESARTTVLKAIEIAHKNNIKVSFDPNIRKKLCEKNLLRKYILEVINKSDIVLPGYEEAKFLLGDYKPDQLCRKILELGPKIVAMKLGKEGCLVADKNKLIHINATKVKKVIDTVGAGDGFDAGFIYGLLKGWDIEKCGKLANDIGAIVTTVNGDIEGLPTIRDIMEFRGDIEVIDR